MDGRRLVQDLAEKGNAVPIVTNLSVRGGRTETKFDEYFEAKKGKIFLSILPVHKSLPLMEGVL